DVTLKMPAFEWVHVQLHQQKGMISLSPPTICNSAGYLADILLIEGNPLSDIRVLQDPDKIALVMKDGVIYKNNIAAISDSKKYQPRLSRKRIEKELHH
ncbi:hypothetical protein, partial [Escherichia coli]|uniref:hypothetical protein n=1 Tax=Escherichia coli TaxID=562 RepID=UPI001BD4C6C7